MIFPEMAVFKQQLVSMPIGDAAAETRKALGGLKPALPEISGKSVAVAVGSRHIDRLDTVVGEVVRFLKDRGAAPFIIAAMGSHGGATEEGQKTLLDSYGITESEIGCPVHADMQTSVIGHTADDLPIHVSKSALAADHVVPINRIKPHTKFCGDIESGLCKMLAIGLGNAEGAAASHRFAVRNSFGFIETVAARLLDHLKVPFGLGVVEDGRGKLSQIRAMPPESLVKTEKNMLKKAYSMLAGIPFREMDILVVDRIGKDISGIGMDSNVTGRHRDLAGDFSIAPNPRRIFVRELSEQSYGNANGIGLADITTSRLVSRMNMEKTAVNAITAISPEKAAVPIHFENDRKCLEVCFHTSGLENGANARIVRIRDTASLEFMEISRPLEDKINSDAEMKIITSWRPWEFDASGNLRSFYPKR